MAPYRRLLIRAYTKKEGASVCIVGSFPLTEASRIAHIRKNEQPKKPTPVYAISPSGNDTLARPRPEVRDIHIHGHLSLLYS